ncbi:MAG TPA: tyrosine--tRNA ligase [Alphaproteobacteria bacterium]|jgi:tyrosyl-tRNA synthetase|nr:tyrosine--tRNA ligase [Alphaproteobacteria bacterium]
MAEPRSDFLRAVVSRGFLHQCTDQAALDALACGKPLAAYIGFDCTADSLHVGSLVQIMLLRLLQRAGHKPIVLLGGGTTKVGDPSGKDESRKLLSDDEIARNKAGIRKVFERFLTFGKGPADALFVDNADWLDGLGYIPFLRDVGRHFSVNRMLGFESVKLRLDREQPLSFLEFNYMVLQAYDFLELARRFDCVLQMGGSDQWGNIVSGVELVRRIEEKTVFGLTAPLITTASGEKMGKTAKGAVWLDAAKLSPYDYWQFWRNTADADTGRFLRLFTDLPVAEIEKLERLRGAELNEAKKTLANQATALVHGEKAAHEAAKTAAETFEKGGAGDALPTITVAKAELAKGIPVFEILRQAGLAASNSESRRLIRGGGARVNDVLVEDEAALVGTDDLQEPDGIIKLSAGKKRHALIRAV